MKAEDLMVGDWVTFNDCEPNEIVPIKIAALGTSELYAHIDNNEVCDVIAYHELTGIPLTQEILEKNGFESDTNMFGLCDYELSKSYILENRGDRFCFVKRITGYPHSTFHVIDVKYIHELQHAFLLCGIDKEIVL